MRLITILLLLVPSLTVIAGDSAHPPESWSIVFPNDGQRIWDELRKPEGKVTSEEVIALSYGMGSHHDGDRQLATAWLLIQLSDDPIPYLRAMMKEEIPERRAFAVLVAGMIADSRLSADVGQLAKDHAKLGDFPGDWFWSTVADAAKDAAHNLDRGGVANDWIKNGKAVGSWLKSQKPKNAEQRDAGNGSGLSRHLRLASLAAGAAPSLRHT